MQTLILLCSSLLLSLNLLTVAPHRSKTDCLPQGIKMSDAVTAAPKKITVEQKLKQLKARCRRGKLVDARGREIRFYQLQGCWGNPPADAQEILERQRKELEGLKKKYTIIEMTCSPEGVDLRQIS